MINKININCYKNNIVTKITIIFYPAEFYYFCNKKEKSAQLDTNQDLFRKFMFLAGKQKYGEDGQRVP
jgi:hypothetical protein